MRSWLFICLCALTLSFGGVTAIAQKSEQVKRLERQRRELTAEIKRTSDLLRKTSNTASAGLKRLNLLSTKIAAQRAVIETLGSEISAADSTLRELGAKLDSLNRELDGRQGAYVKSVQAMQNRKFGHEYLLFILSSKDFDQGIRRTRYLKQYAARQKEEADKLRELCKEVSRKQAEISEEKNRKTTLLSSREKEREELQKSQDQSRQEVKKLQAKKKELQAELTKKQRQAKELNRKIELQIAKEIAESEAKARREAEARARAQRESGKPSTASTPTRKAATKGGYAMNEGEQKLSGSFEANKGRLPAPISGAYTIIGRFGEHAHEQLTHVRVNNSGIDLQGEPSAVARCVFDGVVTRIFVVEGYNNSIIVRHGNYLTVYSNITEVHVKSGDKVSGGQSLGKVYSDPELGGATLLHFQLWKERTKLNPSVWIR